MKNKLKWLVIGSMVLPSLLLSGCGGGAKPAANKEANGGANSNGGEVQNITVWEMYGPRRDFPKIIEEFNKTHPNIKVKDEYFPSHDALLQKVQVISSSNQKKPDAILYDMINVPITKELLPLEDLNTFIKNDSSFDINDFYPAFKDFGNLDGKQYSLHGYANNIVLFYNKKAFKEAGLDPEKPPQTWDELVEDAKKLTKDGQWGLQIDGITEKYFELLSWDFQSLVEENGGEIWNKDYTKPAFNSPQGVEALQFLVDLVNKHKVTTLNPPEKVFETGKAAMYITGTWMTKDYEDSLGKENLGAAFLPKKVQYATNIGGEEWMMVKSNDKEEQATWEFLKYMMSKDVQLQISKFGYIPTRKSVVNSPEYQAWIKEHPAYEVGAKQMEYGKYRAPITTYLQNSQALYKYVQQALYGKITPKEALDTAEKEVTDILATKK